MSQSPRKPKKRTLDEIQLITLTIDGHQEPAYNLADAAVYAGLSKSGVDWLVKHGKLKKYEKEYGKEKFILKKDLDRLNVAHPVDD